MHHVCLVTGNALCRNPRALKEADALHAAGYRVTVLGAWTLPSLAAEDRALLATRAWTFAPVLDLGNASIASMWARLRTAGARRFGTPSHWALGYAGPQLLAAARAVQADLYIAHSEQALWVANRLARTGGRVAVDFEDWFSRDVPAQSLPASAGRRLAELERRLAAKAAYVSCPSESMADAFARELGARPVVVPNAFAWSNRERLDGRIVDRRDASARSLHWYSQTLGPGRGLEELMAALAQLPAEFEVHLRGSASPGYVAALKERLPAEWKTRLFIHAPVGSGELHSRIAEHDIGFAGEQSTCASRDLTISNKLMDYLLCGLAVVASDTRGQREVARRAGDALACFPSGNADALANAIGGFVREPRRLEAARAAALAAARDHYCWERHVPTLLSAVDAALGAGR